MKIDPANQTAQLQYRAAGNPPTTQPHSAISNCFPGLEFDFRNIWRRLFEGIELHEAGNLVLSAEGDYERLVEHRLLMVEEAPTVVQLEGPQRPGGAVVSLTPAGNPEGVWAMEWSNALAAVLHDHGGKTVTCYFTKEKSIEPAGIPTDPAGKPDHARMRAVELKVRPLFDSGSATGEPLAAIDEERIQPGQLTQSLCSPWQNDYRECACYYWAASRPDYVNVEIDQNGTSVGNSWLAKDREPKQYVLDNRRDSRLFSYEDLFRDWQGELRFIVGGEDHDVVEGDDG
ncbi:MAG: hypothetical protein ACTHN3_11795 [Solirubrobacterales bacterium]